ncbi:hypothetical protein SEA_EWALD_2 [Gordonia phage Ewald]|nr:hypothetical protein SEA_EWALD_2 [Gordonia phage Ewald]
MSAEPVVGEFIDNARVLGRHDRCRAAIDRFTQRPRYCELERGHDGLHADCSLSGLVLMTWTDEEAAVCTVDIDDGYEYGYDEYAAVGGGT